MRHAIKYLPLLFFSFWLICTAVITPRAFALQCYDKATNTTTTATTCAPGQTAIAELSDLETIFGNIVSIAGILLGFAFFVMVMLGGVRYLLSGGDPKALQAAKGTLTWGIIGLALFALSFTILLIIQAFTGVNVTVFKIIN